MADQTSQTYANHTKLVPVFHYFVLPVLLLNFVMAGYEAIRAFSFETVLSALVALALAFGALYARVFALGAQDRTIRLEERLRMHGLLPDDLKGRIEDFTIDQIVALRFAADDELPGLARKVLDENIGDRKTIKQMIKVWRADHQRL